MNLDEEKKISNREKKKRYRLRHENIESKPPSLPIEWKNKWIIMAFVGLLLSIIFLIYTFLFTDKMNNSIRMFDKQKMVFQKVFFNKYLIYGNVFESKNETRDKFTRQIIMYISGTAEVSIDTAYLNFDHETGKVVYKTKDKRAPFDVKIYIPVKNIKVVDNIYPKTISQSEAISIASVMGIAGATMGAVGLSKGIVPMNKLSKLERMAIGGILGGAGGLAVGLNTQGMSLSGHIGIKQRDEIIIKAQDMIALSFQYDKKMIERYKKNFFNILMTESERQDIKFSGVVYENR